MMDSPDLLRFFAIYFANLITKLGKKLQFRQRVIATATVFFRRFYLKNSYCETCPYTVIAACCYLASKAEESPVHIKLVVQESRALFNQEQYCPRQWVTDNQKIAEMEFYLVDDLDGDLVVFHPYRTLLALCKKETPSANTSSGSALNEEGEADERDMGVGLGADDGPRYWAAWSIINDTYRSHLCLLYPPHLIAIAAIYLTFIVYPPARPEDPAASLEQSMSTSSSMSMSTSTSTSTLLSDSSDSHPRRSSRQAHTTTASQTKKTAQTKKTQDPITFLAQLNVSLSTVATISQEIISLYTLWDRYKEDIVPDAGKVSANSTTTTATTAASPSPAKRSLSGSVVGGGDNPSTPGFGYLGGYMGMNMMWDPSTSTSNANTGFNAFGTNAFASTPPAAAPTPASVSTPAPAPSQPPVITPAYLSRVLWQMRSTKMNVVTPDSSTPASSRSGGASHGHGGGHGSQTHGPHGGGLAGHGGHLGSVSHHAMGGMQPSGSMGSGIPGGHGHGMQMAVNKRLERTQAAG